MMLMLSALLALLPALANGLRIELPSFTSPGAPTNGLRIELPSFTSPGAPTTTLSDASIPLHFNSTVAPLPHSTSAYSLDSTAAASPTSTFAYVNTTDAHFFNSTDNHSIDPPDAHEHIVLVGFEGCSYEQERLVHMARGDALKISRAVGDPKWMNFDAHRGSLMYDYFGKFDPSSLGPFNLSYTRDIIRNNYRQLQRFGNDNDNWDFALGNYIQIRCGDDNDIPYRLGDGFGGCKYGNAKAHVLFHPNNDVELQGYPFSTIVLCNKFFDEPTLDERVFLLQSQVPDKNGELQHKLEDVRNLASQATLFLHELIHIPRKTEYDAGVSDPRCEDVVVNDFGVRMGRAYGPRQAKWLARAEKYGTYYAIRNVDNFVNYALAKYAETVFTIPKAYLPKFEWHTGIRGAKKRQGWGGDEDPHDDEAAGFSVTVTSLDAVLDDWNFYGGDWCLRDEACQYDCPPDLSPVCSGGSCHCLDCEALGCSAKLQDPSGTAFMNLTMGANGKLVDLVGTEDL
ncbi:unnamed protein product [Zymoseptoria tritici ST99CH_1A5]|uniref:Peptidase M12A domain-containing protein n=2 Tax=Zymoseptoria tritici TaxID=1047171 RepID=A0A1X7S490_ZYMT9|nr:unnamed protein product [Zymoseptoria tritici ST99CH_3D7]SMY28156.1 unnamed protein product [Zymoseptoria tritici ST99CH_1A5]